MLEKNRSLSPVFFVSKPNGLRGQARELDSFDGFIAPLYFRLFESCKQLCNLRYYFGPVMRGFRVNKMFHRFTQRLMPVIASLSLCLFGDGALAQLGDQTALIEALQEGGYVVYMRHGDTTGEPLDRTMNLNNRPMQRNLSNAGRSQSVAIGQAIQRLNMQVGHVATSPVFRARDTAELAFGEDRVEIDEWLTADDYVSGNYNAHISMLRQYLATQPERGNTWLVGHVIPISIATSSEVSRANFPEGAAAIFRPENDQFTLIGILGAGWEKTD